MYRVLIADDHEYVLEGLKFGLENYFEVKTANNSEQCISDFKIFNPHVVMVDYRMRELNGLELAEMLMSMEKPPAVIMFSACMDKDLQNEAAKRGVVDCLSKPFDLGELRSKLYQAIETSL